jgi:hypothetical protein
MATPKEQHDARQHAVNIGSPRHELSGTGGPGAAHAAGTSVEPASGAAPPTADRDASHGTPERGTDGQQEAPSAEP